MRKVYIRIEAKPQKGSFADFMYLTFYSSSDMERHCAVGCIRLEWESDIKNYQ
jgi:hypothetical protein